MRLLFSNRFSKRCMKSFRRNPAIAPDGTQGPVEVFLILPRTYPSPGDKSPGSSRAPHRWAWKAGFNRRLSLSPGVHARAEQGLHPSKFSECMPQRFATLPHARCPARRLDLAEQGATAGYLTESLLGRDKDAPFFRSSTPRQWGFGEIARGFIRRVGSRPPGGATTAGRRNNRRASFSTRSARKRPLRFSLKSLHHTPVGSGPDEIARWILDRG